MASNTSHRMEQYEYSLAQHTKLLASAVFVVGRNPYEYIENDLRTLNHYHDWDKCSIDINYEDKIVEISTDTDISKKATYNESLGCTILPDTEELYFDPIDIQSSLSEAFDQEWPMGDKNAENPNPDGVNKKLLSKTLDRATSNNPPHGMPPGTRALVVLRDGEIIGERYASGYNKNTRHVSWSMGKSVTSALIGLLVKEGHFGVDDQAPIEKWEGDPQENITISHLLRMSSGLEFRRSQDEKETDHFIEQNHHNRVYYDPINVFDFVTSQPLEHEPNTVWRYRNCDTLSLGKIIRDTVENTGRNYLEFPQKALYDKIGVRNMVHEPDPYGNFITTGYNYGTARDWARFGLLHLQEGEWLGEQILPSDWVEYITTPAPAHPEDGYGGQFWLNKSKEMNEVPEDAFYARGARGQTTMMIPSLDMVIVRLGHTPNYVIDQHNALVREIIKCVG